MKLNVLIFKNVAIGAFTQPIFDDHEPDVAAEQLKRLLITEKDVSKVNSYKNLELYLLGTFNDLTGELKVFNQPEMILDCVSIVKERPDYVESEAINRN